MKHLFIWTTVALLASCLLITSVPSFAETVVDRRYFYGGDGRVNLVNAKNGISFKGKYRSSDGFYDRKALKEIDRTFGAEHDEPFSRISLRLIEFLDFLQDRLRPGAQITIVSGWRSPEYNTNLRNKGRLAAKASLHQYGMAADIKMAGVQSKHIWNYVKQLGFGGAGYYHGELVHVDVGPARSWDEKTSGVGTDISQHNKLIGLVTDFDIYRPGERITFRFIRMTAFPIGVIPEFALDSVGEGAGSQNINIFKPSFAVNVGGGCPHFADIGEMMEISYQLPGDIPPGRYEVRASFCERPWEDMPAEISTPEFEILRP